MEQSSATEYFRDLYELGADPSLSLEEKIARTITVGRDRLDVSGGLLSHVDDGDYEIIDSTVSSGDYVAGSVHDLDEQWCRHVVSDRRVLAVVDADDSPLRDDRAREATDVRCYVGAPVLVDGETYGTLCFFDETPRETDFTDDERRFVRLLTRWIGYELERERHHRALDRQNERLDEFAGVLTHDLRTPLTSVRGYTELVLESDAISESDAEDLRQVLDAADRMETLISETLALARNGTDVGERTPVGLGAVARDAWATVDPEIATLVVESDRELLADGSQLRQLFENLFRNVDEHCGPETTVTVRGTDDGFVVADDGPGLPADVADSTFDGDYDSSRLGLSIVERVVSGHGWQGEITVDDGTRFTFSGVGTVADPLRS